MAFTLFPKRAEDKAWKRFGFRPWGGIGLLYFSRFLLHNEFELNDIPHFKLFTLILLSLFLVMAAFSFFPLVGIYRDDFWSGLKKRGWAWLLIFSVSSALFVFPSGYAPWGIEFSRRVWPTLTYTTSLAKRTTTLLTLKNVTIPAACPDPMKRIECSEAHFNPVEFSDETSQVLIMAMQLIWLEGSLKKHSDDPESLRTLLANALNSMLTGYERVMEIDSNPEFPVDRVWAMQPEHFLIGLTTKWVRKKFLTHPEILGFFEKTIVKLEAFDQQREIANIAPEKEKIAPSPDTPGLRVRIEKIKASLK